MSLTIFSHPDCEAHNMGEGHPEQPSRVRQLGRFLVDLSPQAKVVFCEAPRADIEQLKVTHTADYIDDLVTRDAKLQARLSLGEPSPCDQLDPDTLMMAQSWKAALRAAGAAVAAVDQVMSASGERAFAMVRPPGHHALKDAAMGFCILGNVAIAAHHAINRYGLERIAIVDFDVHHGNGTEDIVQGDSRIRLYSSYQKNFYPFPNKAAAQANVIHTPIAAGTAGDAYRQSVAFWFDDLHQFKPQLIIVSAGFDAHTDDPLAQLCLNESDYTWITLELVKLADQYAEGRLVSMLEGGYNLEALSGSVSAHLDALLIK